MAKLVRYISPFGSPATMPWAQARALLEEDDERWCRYYEAGNLTKEQLAIGPPRMEQLPS